MTRQMAETELLPCPFCGHEAVTYRDSDGDWEAFCNNDLELCSGNVASRFPTEAQAIAAWNRRIPPPSEGGGEGWRTIDSAPKDGTPVLVPYPIFKRGNNTDVPDEYEVMIVYWKGVGWDRGWWMLHEEPTHWQPLPSPPAPASPSKREEGEEDSSRR